MTKCLASCLLTVACLLSATGGTEAQDPNRYYRIKNVNSKKVLSVDDKGKDEGDRIIQVVPADSDLQQWKFVKSGDYFKIVNRKSGLALNVKDGAKKRGAPVIQWDAKEAGENSEWRLEKKGEHYAIKARHSGMVLDVAQASEERRSSLIQYPFKESNNENQLFELVLVKDKK